MTYAEAVARLRLDFPNTSDDELLGHIKDFVTDRMENLCDYFDYEEEFAPMIKEGLLPASKHALLHVTDREQYLALWDLDYILEYIEDVKEEERAVALQEREQPQP